MLYDILYYQRAKVLLFFDMCKFICLFAQKATNYRLFSAGYHPVFVMFFLRVCHL